MLRIAFCGCDYSNDCLAMLINHAEFQVLKVFTVGAGRKKAQSKEIVRLAKEHRIPIQHKPISPEEVKRLFEKEACDYIISSCYSYKIPIGNHRGLNIHPTLLPIGRGAWPFPRIILEDHPICGVTIHKLTDRFDAGDIVLQRSYCLDETDTPDTLLCKGQMLGLELLKEWMEDPEKLWHLATPQGASVYWKRPTANDRIVDYCQTPEQINRMVRAYGRDGVYLKTGHGYRSSGSVICQPFQHSYEAGTILYQNDSLIYASLVVAINGGMLYATDTKSLKSPGVVSRAKRKMRRVLGSCRKRVKTWVTVKTTSV